MPNVQRPLSDEGASLGRGLDVAGLDGLGLAEAFRKLVLEDPEIATLGELIVRRDGYKEVFSHGQYPGAFIEHRWPLDVGSEELARQFVRSGITILGGPPQTEPSKEICRVSELIVAKLKALREALMAGDLVAYGTFERTGSFDAIHRLQWARQGMVIDVKSGDLLRDIDGELAVQWSGIALEAPPSAAPAQASDMFHVNSPQSADLRSGRTTSATTHPVPPRPTATRASIAEALAALWSNGIPPGLPVKARDQAIMDWQRSNGLKIVSAKSIQRYLDSKAQALE